MTYATEVPSLKSDNLTNGTETNKDHSSVDIKNRMDADGSVNRQNDQQEIQVESPSNYENKHFTKDNITCPHTTHQCIR